MLIKQNEAWRISSEQPALLKGSKRGIERECLRIDRDGTLALSPHPRALGSALTHSSITTDYSEALLEFITQPRSSIAATLNELSEIHSFTQYVLDQNDERLWPASMPCVIADDDAIPVAQYGSSNSAKLKSTYRVGLGHRYGRMMQTIAGIHYNFSFSDEWLEALRVAAAPEKSLQSFKTDFYFGVIRNFRRYFWLLLYLFGASPMVCKSFAENAKGHGLSPLTHCSYGNLKATALRMGNLGYQSSAQASLTVCYNEIEQYLRTLTDAINQPHPDYAKIGIKVDGEYRQLSDALLQIENEFYSTIRPKRPSQRGETALQALAEGGVEYIEVRCLDINPFNPMGISESQCHFVEAFVLWCALKESPLTTQSEYDEIAINQSRVVNEGRDSSLKLLFGGEEVLLSEFAATMVSEINEAASLLDEAYGESSYSSAVEEWAPAVNDPSLTLSAKFEAYCLENRRGFAAKSKDLATQHAEFWRASGLSAERMAEFAAEAESSLNKQAELESNDAMSFDDYLANYLNQYKDQTLVKS